jgi:hypothetical protein
VTEEGRGELFAETLMEICDDLKRSQYVHGQITNYSLCLVNGAIKLLPRWDARQRKHVDKEMIAYENKLYCLEHRTNPTDSTHEDDEFSLMILSACAVFKQFPFECNKSVLRSDFVEFVAQHETTKPKWVMFMNLFIASVGRKKNLSLSNGGRLRPSKN